MLQQDERVALLELLAYLAAVDGEVSEEELAFIAGSADRLGVEAGDLFEGISGRELSSFCTPFKRTKAKSIALLELINLALIDGHYDDAEKNGVRVIGEMMGVDPGYVDELEAWVERGRRWQEDGRKLLGMS